MRILFCNIARMKYYKGIVPGVDVAKFGGAYVEETGDAGEQYNFAPLKMDTGERCFGMVETKSTSGVKSNQLHIERLEGVSRSADEVDGVLVVWCATHHHNEAVVVGWYRNATVLRNYDELRLDYEDGSYETQIYNIEADAKDCVLLPEEERNRHCWWVPRKRVTRSFGFGQANVWFAEEESAEDYIHALVNQINGYQGENWLHVWPEEAKGER